MWYICLVLSVLCLVAIVVATVLINKHRGTKKQKLNMLYMFFVGVGLAAFFMFLAVHIGAAELSLPGILQAILLALFNALQLFPLGCEFSVVAEKMAGCPEGLAPVFQLWAAALYAFAPMLTFGAVLTLFKDLWSKLRWCKGYFQDAYVFSRLTEKSITLAADIRDKHPKAVIVFAEVQADDASISEWLEVAKRIDAICFSTDLQHVNFARHSAKRPLWFFAISEDESENLSTTLRLVERYKDRENTHLYVFSSKVESELALTTMDKGKIRVRRINPARSLVNWWLYDQGTVLFESAMDTGDGQKHISALVVGMGNQGTELLKALVWYCQMDGYSLKINAFDKDPLAEDKFSAMAPELMDPAYNGVFVPGETQYQIKIHSGQDVRTESFAKIVAGITDATYVMVALGNDEINVDTAVRLRMYFERLHIHPVIQAIVYNTQQKEALAGICNCRGQAYDIQFVGDLESIYTERMILNSELESKALERHLKHGKEETFWTYEYNYRSSMATAIHREARIFCGIPGAHKTEEALTLEERDIIEPLEHRRWNAYMRSEGFVYSGSKEESSRNDLGKMHNDLVHFEDLSEEERRKDSKVGTN